MRKYFIIIIVFSLMLPIIVNAESKYLYDVLKNEAESGELAEEYTGEHHDSLIKEGTKGIYYWKSSNAVASSSNVIFGGFCWKIIRTTDTGGVKLLYNGIPNNNTCESNRPNHYGYGALQSTYINQEYYYGSKFKYDSSTKQFSLDGEKKSIKWDEQTGPNLVGYYTCKQQNENATCSTLYFIESYSSNKYAITYSLNSTTQYSIIGNSAFNLDGRSPSDVGYTYGKKYPFKKQNHRYQMSMNSSSSSIAYGDDYFLNEDGRTYGLTNYKNVNGSEWQNDITPFLGKYKCSAGSTTSSWAKCIEISYISPNSTKHYMYTYNPLENVMYSDSFHYDSNTQKYTLTGNTKIINRWYEDDDLGNRHYTCLNGTGECEQLAYIFNKDANTGHYIQLNNGESIEEAKKEMFSGGTNNEDSSIKKIIDRWYEDNMIQYETNLDDVVYCNNRVFRDVSGFDNTNVFNNFYYKHDPNHNNLLCERIEDSYSVNNNEAKLRYPVGLATADELDIGLHADAFRDNSSFWTMSAAYIAMNSSYYSAVYFEDDFSSVEASISSIVDNSHGIKPVVTLRPNATYVSGKGSMDDPYIFGRIMSKYNVNVEIVDETKDLNINIEDLTQVEQDEEVEFNVTPIKGYKLTKLKILDEEDNEIDYIISDNKNYSFIMPASDVTIIPSYERVKNAVNTENNAHTKEITIEVNDAKAVVYEDKVVFKVVPEDGYIVDEIIIKDKDNNKIDYKKTDDNKYEFIMPDTDVIIIPKYREIKKDNNSIINPKTSSIAMKILLLIILMVYIGTFIYKKKRRVKI